MWFVSTLSHPCLSARQTLSFPGYGYRFPNRTGRRLVEKVKAWSVSRKALSLPAKGNDALKTPHHTPARGLADLAGRNWKIPA
jgi:hypothetical protein